MRSVIPFGTQCLLRWMFLANLGWCDVGTCGNFTCPNEAIRLAAEEARLRSALFWSGQPLPGNWSAPCPISVQLCDQPASGRTHYCFDRGEVFGWGMVVRGRLDELLTDVIPHEVDHAVRASLIRHPIERWLDEGCAALFESAETHRRLRQELRQFPELHLSPAWLAAGQYPSDPRELRQVYCAGFSLVEFLLTRGSPQELLSFQRDPAGLEQRLNRYYGLSVGSLHAGWKAWVAQQRLACADCGCKLHGSTPAQIPSSASADPRPLLTVWTASWCVPCQQFWNDYHTRPDFRGPLDQLVRIERRDAESAATECAARGIVSFPTFETNAQRVTGYLGPDDLLARLRTMLTPIVTSPAEPMTPLPPASPPPPVSTPTRPPHSIDSAPFDRLLKLAPLAITLLEWTGIAGGALAGGGIGGLALGAGVWLIKRRFRQRPAAMKRHETNVAPERGTAALPAPFPRELDEACQLLELGQAEGRVGVLDTLRGLFLDDELDKLTQSNDPQAANIATRLRSAIDARVDEVAPLSVRS